MSLRVELVGMGMFAVVLACADSSFAQCSRGNGATRGAQGRRPAPSPSAGGTGGFAAVRPTGGIAAFANQTNNLSRAACPNMSAVSRPSTALNPTIAQAFQYQAAIYEYAAQRRARNQVLLQQRLAHVRRMRDLAAATTDRPTKRQLRVARLREREAEKYPIRTGAYWRAMQTDRMPSSQPRTNRNLTIPGSGFQQLVRR